MQASTRRSFSLSGAAAVRSSARAAAGRRPSTPNKSSALQTALARPSRSRAFVPCELGEKMLPGTAYTGFPYRSAWFTVDMVPLFSCASTTTSAEDSAAMRRLRCKKPFRPTGSLSGGYSLMTQPFRSICHRSSRLEAG